MNIIATIHKQGLPLAAKMGHVWRNAATYTAAVSNSDCPSSYPWADRTLVWQGDPGHHTLEQCRRHLMAFELAAELEGTTAVLEPDAFVNVPFEAEEGILYGSRLWDSLDELKDRQRLCRWFVHPPYVATRQTWKEICKIFRWWMNDGMHIECGFADRVLALAAQAAMKQVRGIGFSRNTVLPEDEPALRQALADQVPIIHGVKDWKQIAWWAAEKGLVPPPDLWEEFGIEKDTRNPPWAIDLRHANILRAVVEKIRPKVVMEIGSHKGHSTAAFVKALDACPDTILHLVEPAPTPELHALLQRSPHKQRIVLHTENSWETGLRADMVFIDGDHGWPCMADLSHALCAGTPVIAVHDTQSHGLGIGGCEGAQKAADILRAASGRTWVCDEVKREGEYTHRGFGISATKHTAGIREIFEQICK